MMRAAESFEKQWMDDHLDLLHYAKQIGDTAWQQEIVRTLEDAKRRIEQAKLEIRTEALWRQFDAINTKVVELYRQLRETGNAYIAAKITEEVWQLKVRRVEIGRQLNAALQKT
ncbi:hypothetical protein H8B09_24795 [Paenibacillus sp. PR3]|uniref:Uncharacterized protein n=1 Tax=Paenibacillus terricola TaxID=2763503 RepID=A0ABR8N1E2_9BACL|nr:hypothetical protein [Paenibacillus terricola]MBD3922003.1 hypothetical protein [Paenibacillus terricola]